MQQEMEREDREFQREVREESRNLMAAVPKLIAQTVSKMGLAFNIHPLNAIEGGPILEKQLLIGSSAASPKSSDSLEPVPNLQRQAPSLEPLVVSQDFLDSAPLVEVIVTPAATLPGLVDRLVGVKPMEDVSATMDVSANDLDFTNFGGGESSRPQASASNKVCWFLLLVLMCFCLT